MRDEVGPQSRPGWISEMEFLVAKRVQDLHFKLNLFGDYGCFLIYLTIVVFNYHTNACFVSFCSSFNIAAIKIPCRII